MPPQEKWNRHSQQADAARHWIHGPSGDRGSSCEVQYLLRTTRPPGEGRLYDLIYDIVRLIPAGHVATYGQIAMIVGRCTPRLVGYALAALPYGSDVPWHRVINSKGKISLRSSEGQREQQALLEAEGVQFDEQGRTDLAKFGWAGPQD